MPASDPYDNPVPAETAARRAIVTSPIGRLSLHAEAGALVAISWTDGAPTPATNDPILAQATRQLDAYFSGRLQDFDLPLRPEGDPFEQAVWAAMRNIPFGSTETYGFIAKQLEKPARAVGGACGRNPIPIVIPCHRVVGADGRMTGYSGQGGVETKQWLLRHEGALLL